MPVVHIDLYRLNDAREIEDLGIEELGSDGVVAIEWAEKLGRTPLGAIRVNFEDAGGNPRTITVENRD